MMVVGVWMWVCASQIAELWGQNCSAERFFFFFCLFRGGSDEDMTSGLTRAHAFGPGNLCRPKRPSGGVGQ